MLPIPERLLQAGVDDMVRISDARMSGHGVRDLVLHVSPESAAGGPLPPSATATRSCSTSTRARLDLEVAAGRDRATARRAAGAGRRGTRAATARLLPRRTSGRRTRAATSTSSPDRRRRSTGCPTASSAGGSEAGDRSTAGTESDACLTRPRRHGGRVGRPGPTVRTAPPTTVRTEPATVFPDLSRQTWARWQPNHPPAPAGTTGSASFATVRNGSVAVGTGDSRPLPGSAGPDGFPRRIEIGRSQESCRSWHCPTRVGAHARGPAPHDLERHGAAWRLGWRRSFGTHRRDPPSTLRAAAVRWPNTALQTLRRTARRNRFSTYRPAGPRRPGRRARCRGPRRFPGAAGRRQPNDLDGGSAGGRMHTRNSSSGAAGRDDGSFPDICRKSFPRPPRGPSPATAGT